MSSVVIGCTGKKVKSLNNLKPLLRYEDIVCKTNDPLGQKCGYGGRNQKQDDNDEEAEI
ncbi:hypothetical protein D3C85_1136650 [compost metagenome]